MTCPKCRWKYKGLDSSRCFLWVSVRGGCQVQYRKILYGMQILCTESTYQADVWSYSIIHVSACLT